MQDMINQYVNNGQFDRTQLALAVKNGKISAGKLTAIIQQIDEAVASGNIQEPYIGSSYSNKRKKSEWNSRYLDYLVAEVSSSEVFNKDSLTYLAKVAKYVNSSATRTFEKIILSVIVLGIVFFAGWFTGKNGIEELKKENERLASKVSELEIKTVISEETPNEDNVFSPAVDDSEKIEAEQEVISNENNVTPSSTGYKIENELDVFISRALNGENVRNEFQSTDYSSADVEKRALERNLTRAEAEKLVENLVNSAKFDVNKFGD